MKKGRDPSTQTRQKLSEILTPDQQQKLREMMGGPGGGPGAVPAGLHPVHQPMTMKAASAGSEQEQRQSRTSAGSDKKMADDKTMMDDKSMADGGEGNGSKPLRSRRSPLPKSPPAPGEGRRHCPSIHVEETRRPTGDFSEHEGPHHRAGVRLVDMSSVSRSGCCDGEVKKRVRWAVQFFVVYGREAHAKGEWEVGRNKDLEYQRLAQPSTADARSELAKKAQKELKITMPILLDSMGTHCHRLWRRCEHTAIIIGKDGNIFAKQEWCDPSGLKREIEEAGKSTPATKPVLR